MKTENLKPIFIFILFLFFSYSCSDNEEKVILPEPSWKGKHILWLGTSIPAGGKEEGKCYPSYTAKRLDAIIHNEAIGSSMVRKGNYKGEWAGMHWNPLSLSLSQTIEEKLLLIKYFESGLDKEGNICEAGEYGWKHICLSAPETLTEHQKKQILASSYETLLVARYLDRNHPEFIVKPDLIVFDHGYNDLVQSMYDKDEEDAIRVPDPKTDRNYFIGAMNYLIEVIREYDPDQKIVFIGHYESARKERVYRGQISLFHHRNFPFLKLWEKLNWTQDIDPETGKTITRLNMEDDLHPHTDTRIDPETGFKVAIKTIGEQCYEFIKEIK
ncbi:MAG: hypothetical protein LUG18_15905 [Candidatus Azobacteroides sp.]|nr:hypothetical protein [Candidatus Azobacteroides sp.]